MAKWVIFIGSHFGTQLTITDRVHVEFCTFSNSVCDIGNHLPEDIVTGSSLNIFKNKRDRHLRENWRLEPGISFFN